VCMYIYVCVYIYIYIYIYVQIVKSIKADFVKSLFTYFVNTKISNIMQFVLSDDVTIAGRNRAKLNNTI